MVRTAVFLSGCVFVGIADIRTMRIPDALLLAIFSALVFFDRGGLLFYQRFVQALGCFTLFYLVFYFSRGIGFGDVKYAALIGYALDGEKILSAFFAAALGGMLVYAWGRGAARWDKSVRLPFAPFLSAGAAAAVFDMFHLPGLEL
jgi:prepilin signal peptidase PulO-like enzyme (type II secretory pathway)